MSYLPELFEFSDKQLFETLADDPNAEIASGKIAATYDGYKDLQTEHNAWIKHYAIAAALLLAAQLQAITDYSVLGAAVRKEYIPAVALLYLAFSAVVWTNYELKMRVYRAVYEAELERMEPSTRMLTLLRYPLAFLGPAFTAPNMVLKSHVMSTKDMVLSLPTIVVIMLVKLAALACLTIATTSVVWEIYNADRYLGAARYAILATFFVGVMSPALLIRNAMRKHVYADKNSLVNI